MPNSGSDITGGGEISPITVYPLAFASIADKVNELVKAMNKANLAAKSPIQIIPGDQGKLVTLDMKALMDAIYGSPTDDSGAGSGGSGSGAIAVAIGSDGALYPVIVPPGAQISGGTQFPSYIRQGNDINTTIALADTGFYINSNLSGGATLFQIEGVQLTHNMSIQTWAVCNSGTPASALVMASTPF